jgi:hypothetical protein
MMLSVNDVDESIGYMTIAAAVTPSLEGMLAGGGGGGEDPFANDSLFPAQGLTLVPSLLKKEPVSGVIYDSKVLQIGYKAQADSGSQCKMVLYHGNRSSEPITNVVALLPDHDAFKVQVRPLATEPFTVEPSKQVLHYFLWVCRKPFTDTPAITIKFTFQGA